MIVSHNLKPKGSIEGAGGGIALCHSQSQPIGAVFCRPMSCGGQNVAGGALAALGGAHLDGVEHGGLAMQGDEGCTGGFVLGTAKDHGLGAGDTLHHRKATGADIALGPDVAGDLHRWPMRKGGHPGRRRKGCDRCCIAQDLVDQGIAPRGQSGIKRFIARPDHEERVLAKRLHRGLGLRDVAVDPGAMGRRGADAFTATGTFADEPRAGLMAGEGRPGRLHRQGECGDVQTVWGKRILCHVVSRASKAARAASRRTGSVPRITRLVPKLPLVLKG